MMPFEETVARKLAMFLFDTWGDAEGVVWAGLDDGQREKARKAARAAIFAIADRNPTGGDVKQAPLRSNESGGAEGNRPNSVLLHKRSD